MAVKLKLTREEHGQMMEVADVEGRDDVKEVIKRTRIVEGREDLTKVRDLAAQVVEVNAHERYGFDAIEGLYDRASAELYR